MPIYEYECKNCKHTLDILQKMSDPPAVKCPHCAEDSLVRLVSAAGFQLKGTGWYVTDFRDKDKSKTQNTSATHTDAAPQAKDSPQDNTAKKATTTESNPTATPSVAKTTSDQSQASVQSKTGASSHKKNSEKS